MDLLIENVRYHIEVCGEGEPLLLLHGFTGDSTTWTSFCSTWGKQAKLIIPDLIGHGKTEAPVDVDLNRYSIESAATDLVQILEELGVGKVNLLGYSMGGRLALTFASLFPEKVGGLILESASPGLSSETEREKRRMKDRELAHFIKDSGIPKFVDFWEKIPLFKTMDSLSDTVRDSIRQQRLSQSEEGLANSLQGMGTGSQPSWWEKLSRIEHKVLLLTGEKDEKFCGIADRMRQKLKNSTWVIVKNSGHAIHVEEKEKFDTIVSEFLANT